MPNWEHEQNQAKQGYQRIAGIDEAGRGPLAGPVVAGAVILPKSFASPFLDDSKKLSPKKRELIYDQLTSHPQVTWASGLASVEEIDRHNILQATYLAMQRALEALNPNADFALIDGRPVPNFPIPNQALVKGDSKSLSIAAASIIAKVTRDRLMQELARHFPEYGFDSHKGYGTRAHLQALKEHGPTHHHRRSFQPVAQCAISFNK